MHRKANIKTISEPIRRRKTGKHGLDTCCKRIPVALAWAPEGKCKRGRSTETLRRRVEKEGMAMGYCSWVKTGLVAADREEVKILAPLSIRKSRIDDDA